MLAYRFEQRDNCQVKQKQPLRGLIYTNTKPNKTNAKNKTYSTDIIVLHPKKCCF